MATGPLVPKSSKNGWKTKEQVDYMLSHWPDYTAHQTSKTLDRFWPLVYDGWYKRWPITPTSEQIGKHGSRANALLVLRSDKNDVSAQKTLSLTLPADFLHPLTANSRVVSQPGSSHSQNH